MSKYDFDNERFFMTHDFGDIGFMKINGKLEKLHMDKYSNEERNFSNTDYTVVVKVEKTEEDGYVGFRVYGTVKITSSNGLEKTINYVGFGGC